jgi:uncharacterized LabA/DUF88 family protein
MRTYVYVDGFNLYFGALRRTRYRWLNLQRLCELMLATHNRIDRIKYFTARVTQRPQNPLQPARQQAWLRALKTLPSLDIIFGHFLTHDVRMPLAGTPPGQPLTYVTVLKTEEKGSDVNLATHLVNDAHLDRFDLAVIISNDSDLIEAVRIVKGLGKTVGVLNPHQHPSRALLREATFMKPIRQGPLSASQFPDYLKDATGSFHKPVGW